MTLTIDHIIYRHIIRDQETCVQYLKERGLLLANNLMKCIKVKNRILCNGQLVKCLRHSKKQNSDGPMRSISIFDY